MTGAEPVGPVLITGGRGFLGRALARVLVAAGETVVSLDLPPVGAGESGVIDVAGDIADPDAITRIVEAQGVRAIVHLAALVIPACRADPVRGAQVNVMGHLNMLSVAVRCGIGRFVYTSSVAARPRPPLDAPANLYGVWKRACEDASAVWHGEHGLASIGLRPNVVYGPGRLNGETAAITLAIRAAARGEPYEIPFDGKMCFQHLDEVTDILHRCLRASPPRPVVSDLTTEQHSITEVIAEIHATAPRARITHAPQVRLAPQGLDNSALVGLLGNWRSVTLAEGVRRTLEHYRTAGKSTL